MRIRTLRVVAVVAAVVAIAPGCGSDPARRPTPPASQGVAAYIQVLRGDDPRPAYELLSQELRQDLDYETFALHWKESAKERAAQARELEESLQSEPDLGEKAKLEYPDGKTVSLSRQNDRWHVDAAMVSRYHAGRPHDAVTLFADALSERDYMALLQLLTERRRKGIASQVDAFVSSLQKRLAEPDNVVELIGDDRAEMRWDDGHKRYKIILLRDGEEWRVDDIQLQPTPIEPEEGPE